MQAEMEAGDVEQKGKEFQTAPENSRWCGGG